MTQLVAAWQIGLMSWTASTPTRCLLVLCATFCGACDGSGGDRDGGAAGADAGGLAAAHARLSWRMRCTSATDCPFEDPPARSIDHDNGEDGHEVICDVQFNGETRRMDLTARAPDGYGIEVRGATIGPEGGRLMGSLCQIRVFEPDDVDLLTMCTSSNPSEGSACQLQRIDIRDVDGVPSLIAELRCLDAPEEGRPMTMRDITPAMATSGSTEIVFTGCAGL